MIMVTGSKALLHGRLACKWRRVRMWKERAIQEGEVHMQKDWELQEGEAIQEGQDQQKLAEMRNQVIVRTSVIGIFANILLAGFKAAVGLLAGSIAVTLDAVNNLSDALSSVITIVGTKLAGKKPDKKHPLGYGRMEYLSAMIVAALVLYAGITSFVESVKKIVHPLKPDYSVVSLVIIASAVIVKIVLGRYVKAVGEKVHSGALTASGSDAMFDAILSFSVLLSAFVFLGTGLSLEAYVGIAIAIVIVKAGIEMFVETLDEILGRRVDREIIGEIKKTICEEECVSGAYDLILHSYGPERYIGSVHVEVPDVMTAEEIDVMERRISNQVLMKHGILLTGIGIYSVNTKDDEVRQLRTDVNRMIMAHDGVLQVHGFYVQRQKKQMSLDVILDFALDDREAVFEEIKKEVANAYPDYQIRMTMDIDI